MKKPAREFQVFVKPAGALCNLRCRYCYYLEKKNLYKGTCSDTMSDKVLENYIRQHIEASTEENIIFSWHGGEPLMAGLDFYSKAVELQKRYKPEGRNILNGIQTNGTLLDEEWCSFLSNEKFMVGISIDGPGELHDRLRVTDGGKPTLNRVLSGFEMLQKHNILIEILCVVSSVNVGYPLAVYDFFRRAGAGFITFIPLVERIRGSDAGVSNYTVPAEEFGMFLCTVFDEWKERDIGTIKVQIFEEALRAAFDQEHTLCIFRENCGGVPVLERNGDLYSCDHYVDEDHFLGNISERPLAEFLDSDRQQAFGRIKSESLPGYCLRCEVRKLCNGECPKNRFIRTPDGEPGLNYLCSGYRRFFSHILPFIRILREVWKKDALK